MGDLPGCLGILAMTVTGGAPMYCNRLFVSPLTPLDLSSHNYLLSMTHPEHFLSPLCFQQLIQSDLHF
jgi:hypothetical protein